MAKKSGSLDYWRNYFRTANSDIFDIIDHAIMVAASDCPKEFRLRRDRITERLFCCRLTRCSGCDHVELAVPGGGDDGEDSDDGGFKSDFDRDGGEEFEAGASKESKVNTSRDDRAENQVSNFSYGDAEALTDEIEEESQIVGEVLRIKEILHNCEEETESVLFDSLRKLQLMALTVDTLKATEIGKAVNGLRKHSSKEIRHLARTLIDVWKDMVDEWVSSTAAIASMNCTEGTPDSVNPSVVDDEEEEGLPSPPLDEGAFFAAQTTSMELSGFFDGMDDDGSELTLPSNASIR
ncbi:Transcription elongation factor [Trema orientale]|uniref:Transcription elongation factor n=1 Tax=Trema orientale TaxID=63057 RepID=A0A2P5FRU5_TREOI|nr:Transcription elongation factor [Trema orientale]